jgi:hypothetical protein
MDIQQQIDDAIKNPEPATPEAIAELAVEKAHINEMPPDDIKALFYAAFCGLIDNREYAGVIERIDFYLKPQGKVASAVGSRPNAPYTDVELLATDFSAGVQMGYSLSGSKDKGFKAHPTPLFCPLYVIHYTDGMNEPGMTSVFLEDAF